MHNCRCNNGYGDVCLWANALCPHDPTQEPVSVSYTELLLGNAEEFGVWPWSGSLCANHHFRFLRLPGAVHISIKTRQPHQGDISKTTLGLTSCFLNTHTKERKKEKSKYTSIIKTNNGKIAFFGQGQPVHFDYLFSLVHIISFCPHTSPFHKMIVRLLKVSK